MGKCGRECEEGVWGGGVRKECGEGVCRGSVGGGVRKECGRECGRGCGEGVWGGGVRKECGEGVCRSVGKECEERVRRLVTKPPIVIHAPYVGRQGNHSFHM